jgi:peptide/nickel transport system permease protein
MRNVVSRLASSVILFWIVLTITFLLVRAAPGDPTTLLVPPGASAEDQARLRAELGLDAPLAVQYARWAGRLFKADLGESFARRAPVRTVLAEAIPVSAGLGAISLALTFVLGIALGTYQAARRGTLSDRALTIATTTVYAAPSFWLALALIATFTYGAARWGFPASLRLPAFGMRDPASDATGLAAVADLARHAVLPVVTLAAIGAAGIARYARTITADLISQDFMRTARAKGVTRSGVYLRHLLANAWPPLVVLLALAIPGLLAGSVFVEGVFAWPGMGRVTLAAVAARDYPVILGATVVYTAAVILANLAADLALPMLDPRRRA